MTSSIAKIRVITETSTYLDLDIRDYDFNRALLCVLAKNGLYKEGKYNPFFSNYLLLFWNLGHEFIIFLNKNSLEKSRELVFLLYHNHCPNKQYINIFSEFLDLLIYQNFDNYPQ